MIIFLHIFCLFARETDHKSMIMQQWKRLHWRHDTATTPEAVISDRDIHTLSIVTNIYKYNKFEPHVITRQHGSQITVIFMRTWFFMECAWQDIQQIQRQF